VAIATFAGGFSSYAPAGATQDTTNGNNRGDVWVDNVGVPQSNPEMDPHLACADIAIWGMKLNDASGTYAIQGWPPSGGGASDQDYSGTWSFDTSSDTLQQIATVNVQTLIANAIANGDTAQSQQGFHFKLDVEDPRGQSVGDDKYKTFWVNCAAPTPTPTPTGGVGGSTPTPTPPPSPTPTESSPSPTPTGTVSGSTPTPTPTESSPSPQGGVLGSTSTPAPTGGVGGITTPNTGTELPLGISGTFMGVGLGLLALSRRMRPRTRR
jgi:hypothetical protein